MDRAEGPASVSQRLPVSANGIRPDRWVCFSYVKPVIGDLIEGSRRLRRSRRRAPLLALLGHPVERSLLGGEHPGGPDLFTGHRVGPECRPRPPASAVRQSLDRAVGPFAARLGRTCRLRVVHWGSPWLRQFLFLLPVFCPQHIVLAKHAAPAALILPAVVSAVGSNHHLLAVAYQSSRSI